MLSAGKQTRPTKVQNNIMNQKFPCMLQKYNINPVQIPLSERLGEANRFKNFSAKTGDLLLDFSRTGLDQQSLTGLLAHQSSSQTRFG